MLRTLADQVSKQSLLLRLRQLTPETKRRWGRMSAHQMVCHLSDSFRGAMGEKAVASVSNVFTRTALRWAGLHLPLPRPRGFPTLREVDQEMGGTKPTDFTSDVRELEQLIERFASSERSFQWTAHPIFGRMSEWEWLRWGWLHVHHHLDQFGL